MNKNDVIPSKSADKLTTDGPEVFQINLHIIHADNRSINFSSMVTSLLCNT